VHGVQALSFEQVAVARQDAVDLERPHLLGAQIDPVREVLALLADQQDLAIADDPVEEVGDRLDPVAVYIYFN
jgi:hypothetical protein